MALNQDILKIRSLKKTKKPGEREPAFDPLQMDKESDLERDPYSDPEDPTLRRKNLKEVSRVERSIMEQDPTNPDQDSINPDEEQDPDLDQEREPILEPESEMPEPKRVAEIPEEMQYEIINGKFVKKKNLPKKKKV